MSGQKTVLITGGAGFIGANLILFLRRQRPDWRLVCVDALTYAGSLDNLGDAARDPELAFYRADIRDREQIYDIFARERPDAVIHLAAESHVDRSIADPGIFLQTNVLGTGVLMDACLRCGTERFHQVGTDEVYGDLPPDRPDLLFTEASPLRPSSPYSASKASADLLALAYHRTYGLGVTISRCSNNYGPLQYPEKLIPLMIRRALRDQPLPVYGTGRNIRDWLYVEDHCAGILAVLERGAVGEVYNLGGRNERTNLDIVRLILRELNKPESLITFVPDRKGHDLRYAIDPTRARTLLGWTPVTPFEEGIRGTIQWYKQAFTKNPADSL